MSAVALPARTVEHVMMALADILVPVLQDTLVPTVKMQVLS